MRVTFLQFDVDFERHFKKLFKTILFRNLLAKVPDLGFEVGSYIVVSQQTTLLDHSDFKNCLAIFSIQLKAWQFKVQRSMPCRVKSILVLC